MTEVTQEIRQPSRTGSTATRRAVEEFGLTCVLLFLVVSSSRWVLDPASPLHVPDLGLALAVLGVFSGLVVAGLILSPPGKRCGGHMNPAITIAVWLLEVFPGRQVLPYVAAQFAGSVVGVGLAYLTWGEATEYIGFAAVRAAPGWDASSVFLAETGIVIAVVVLVGYLLARPSRTRLMPYAIGVVVTFVITVFGPLSGGSANPARQWGPALFASGLGGDLWIYLTAPVLGAVLGAGTHYLLARRQARALVSAQPPS
ncbi:aquaporin [Allokutzneria sp. A3M-2-11 16]|uniref:MIP/aquaporin family protein n=1 Tax=Allokutzneria sp. A3M-2-11 16 TaxID=2962043 RepID=UPI0020B7232C|nr:aquaporin [Allokutzneria sp. A3M-2-11 16]MCP3804978.1 aquaporin [Allokutzneria sp. A3M-2-11 16]